MIRVDSHHLESNLNSLSEVLSKRSAEELFSLYDPSPGAIITVKEKPWGTIGYLAIDTLVSGKCSGGIRMVPDISEDEVIHLARAMTLKFAFKNSAIGGAKSGIVAPPEADGKLRQELLEAFGRQLRPVLNTFYGMGGDIGVGPEEVRIVKQAAGLDTRPRPADLKSGFFTALGVFFSARTAAFESGLRAEDCKLAIEGYGNVGRELVRLFQRAGFKIIALSTLYGALFNPEGLDVDRLENLARVHGDRVVEHYSGAEVMAKSRLFTCEADMVIPGARPWTISAENAPHLRARAIVPAANIPVTREAAKILFQKGIIYIPDFVTTSGGIFGCSLMNQGFGEMDAVRIVERTFCPKIARLMELSRERGSSVEDVAVQIAKNNFQALQQKQALKNRRLKYFFLKLKEERSLAAMTGRMAGRLFQKTNGRKFLSKMLRPFAVSHATRNAISDMKRYPRAKSQKA